MTSLQRYYITKIGTVGEGNKREQDVKEREK